LQLFQCDLQRLVTGDSCRALQCVAVCRSVSQCVAVCCSVLQCVAVRCSVTQSSSKWMRADSHTSAASHIAALFHLFIPISNCCVAVYCSLLQFVAVCCSALQCIAVHCSVLQCIAVRCSALQRVLQRLKMGVLQCVAVCCSALQCVAVCCSVLQCVAVCCSASYSGSKWVRADSRTSVASNIAALLRLFHVAGASFWRVEVEEEEEEEEEVDSHTFCCRPTM